MRFLSNDEVKAQFKKDFRTEFKAVPRGVIKAFTVIALFVLVITAYFLFYEGPRHDREKARVQALKKTADALETENFNKIATYLNSLLLPSRSTSSPLGIVSNQQYKTSTDTSLFLARHPTRDQVEKILGPPLRSVKPAVEPSSIVAFYGFTVTLFPEFNAPVDYEWEVVELTFNPNSKKLNGIWIAGYETDNQSASMGSYLTGASLKLTALRIRCSDGAGGLDDPKKAPENTPNGCPAH